MKQMQRVVWTKGVLLTPQHLQVQDRFLESQLRFRTEALFPCSWGFTKLEVDRDSVAAGSFAVEAMSGILPDGTAFEMPAAEPLPPARHFSSQWHPDRVRARVFLALPASSGGGQQISEDGATRYRPELILRRDENTGVAERPIEVARKNMRFLFEGESFEGQVVMQVASVVRAPEGYILDPEFVPPVLSVASDRTLHQIARRIVELMVARLAAISALRRRRNRGLASFGVSDLENFWLLYNLSECLPGIRHFLTPGHGHPEAFFRELVAFVGSLRALQDGPESELLDLPVYDHGDLGGIFAALERRVENLLQSAVPARYVVIPLIRGENAIFTGRLDDPRLRRSERFFLGFASSSPQNEIIERVPHSLKAASATRVGHLVNFATPGLTLRHVPDLPPSVPVRSGYEYFEVDRSHSEWPSVTSSQTFSVFVPAEFRDPKLELVAMLEGDGD